MAGFETSFIALWLSQTGKTPCRFLLQTETHVYSELAQLCVR